MARPLALVAAVAVSLLAVSGAGGADVQTPKRGGVVVVATNDFAEPQCLSWLPVCDSLGRAEWRTKVLALPFAPEPYGFRNDLVETWELNEDPLHGRLPHPSPRPLERRGSDQRSRLRVRLQHVSRKLGSSQQIPATQDAFRRVQAVDAKTVRFVFQLRTATGGSPQLPAPASACASWPGPGEPRPLARSDRQPEDGEADRQRPLSSSAIGSSASR